MRFYISIFVYIIIQISEIGYYTWFDDGNAKNFDEIYE
jgi:hypothetical protein